MPGVIAEAEANAIYWMERLELEHASTGVLDEIFNHSEPILEIAELRSQAILKLEPHESRGKQDWNEVPQAQAEFGPLVVGTTSASSQRERGSSHRYL